ncbi:MAG: amidohydrolase family protein [Gammaproteobacteria bacterium]|jgi:Tol biopolymer transport system component
MRALLLILWLGAIGVTHAEVIDVSEGTNLTLAIHPDNKYMVVDLLGGLWRLPIAGGGATALVPANSGVAQPRFDPSGRSIVFQRWLDGQWDIWRFTPDTGRLEALTDSEFNEREPEFTADGREVVFAGDRTGQYSLWSLDLETSALRQLTDEVGHARFPTVDGDGSLAYVSVRDSGSEIKLYEGSPRGRTIRRSDRRLAAPSWRPGGGVLVVNARAEGGSNDLALYIDADEPIWRRLTDSEDVFIGRAAWVSEEEYVYAADGALWRRGIGSTERSRILMFAGVSVEELAPAPPHSRLDAGGPHSLAGINGIVHHGPSQRAAFTALGDLWLFDDGEVSRLTDDGFTDASPRFSPDGEWLVFSSDRSGKMEIWRLRIDSGQMLQLTSESGQAIKPLVSGDGRFVAYLETEGFDTAGGAALRLMAIDEPYESTVLATGLIAPRELVWQGRYLRLIARDADSADSFPHVYETPAGESIEPAAQPETGVEDLVGHTELRWTPTAPESDYVIQAGRLFDGIGSDYRYHVDIHVAGQRITDVVSRDRLPLPDRVIDARDLTVVPGLIDVHAHLPPIASSMIGRSLLEHGITTVNDVDSDWRAALELAEAWASGQQAGPRVMISTTVPPTDIAVPVESPIVISTSPRVLGGLRHAFAAQRLRDGFEEPRSSAAGFDEEGPFSPRIALSPLGKSYSDVFELVRASGAYLATGLSALDSSRGADEMPGLADGFEWVMRNSGRIAIGTDAPHVSYGPGFHDELELLAERGMPEDQILRFATAGGAIALGLSLDVGTLEPGRLADLLVLDGDPLDEIGDLALIEAVVVGGNWHDIESIENSR